ncbi:MAG: LAGLIDADG family homing endonuclease [Agathobacter sp.]|nr:LAGLIDADG family homing endonuclease [Agathobacter sp.]
MKYNNEFRQIDTEEKAYFLGQAFGDGCNSKYKHNYKFILASIEDDFSLYQKLQQCFPFLRLKRYTSHSNMIYLECCQKALYEDLVSLGLKSNKTKHDSTGEFHFPDIDVKYLPHFIRGYFDADGSAWYPSRHRSRNSLHIDFGCATPNFLKSLDAVLAANGIKFTWNQRLKKASNGKFYMSYSLVSSNRSLSIKFADYIYSTATIFLERKRELCYKEKDLRPSVIEEYGPCPYCHGTHSQRKGIRDGKQRLKCSICNKMYTVALNHNADSDSNI